MSKRKYIPEIKVPNIAVFSMLNNKWFIFNGKTVHREVLKSFQYRTLERVIHSGLVFVAMEVRDGKKL